MINLTRHTINGKISLGSLVNMLEEYKDKEKDIANRMYKLRGIFPRPDEYIELRGEMALIKSTLYDIRNCLKIYHRYGNINGLEVIKDRQFHFPKEWEKATRIFDTHEKE